MGWQNHQEKRYNQEIDRKTPWRKLRIGAAGPNVEGKNLSARASRKSVMTSSAN